MDIKKERIYDKVIQSAIKSLPNLKNQRHKKIYNDTSYVDSVRLDDAIFFNKNRSKCLLLALQITAKDFKNNHVLIVQGTFNKSEWVFSFDRFPPVPEIRYTIEKSNEVKKDFKNLSIKGRLFILNTGKVTDSGCEIDNKFWFGE